MAMERENRAPRAGGPNRKRKKVCQFCVDKCEYIDYKDAAKLLFAHFCPFVNKMRWIFAVIAAHALALKNGVINIPVKLFVQKRINDDFRKIHHFLTG